MSAAPGSQLEEKMGEAFGLVGRAIDELAGGKTLVGKVVLFSGGNDSTVLAHLMRVHATHFAHCNTGIGIEQTREFVRHVAADWGIPLIEKHPGEGNTYRELVMAKGFPGPAMHWKMYQRLKERALRQVRAELVKNPRRERVLFIAGRRRAESARREAREIPEMERVGSVVWVSPLVHWSNQDILEYRKRFDVPRNEVADLLHMSGECLCGAFASKGELDEIGMFFPEMRDEIKQLEDEVRSAGTVRPERCAWGWGADRQRPSKSGPLCSSCDSRLFPGQMELEFR